MNPQNRPVQIFENAFDGILVIDESQFILLSNEAANRLFGYENLEGKYLETLMPKVFKKKHLEYVKSFNQAKQIARAMHNNKSVDGLNSRGETITLDISISRISDVEKTEFVAFIRDVTAKEEILKQLSFRAHIDPLTGLFNRGCTQQVLGSEFLRSKRYNCPMSVIFIDIDHFKQINDNFGHEFGDEVLRKVASSLKSNIRSFDKLGRWGGEEFLLLLPNTELSEACLLAEKLRLCIADIASSGSLIPTITASLGVSAFDSIFTEPEELVNCADKQMYLAKRQGRNCVRPQFELA